MLPPANRLRRSSDFARVIRTGARARRGHVIVHLDPHLGAPHPQVGLVVSKAVGGSVIRHQVSRRLRHALALRIDRLPAGSGTVVRALPGAAEDSSVRFATDLDAAFERLVGAR